jgi:hypothetical protein
MLQMSMQHATSRNKELRRPPFCIQASGFAVCSLACVRLLLSAKADVHKRHATNGRTALLYACADDDNPEVGAKSLSSVCAAIAAHGPDPFSSCDTLAPAALHAERISPLWLCLAGMAHVVPVVYRWYMQADWSDWLWLAQAAVTL